MNSHPLGHHRPPYYRKPAKKSFRSTKAWADYRRTALAYYAMECYRCGLVSASNQVHHLDPVGEGNPPFPTLDRVRVLCADCHRRQHSSPGRVAWDDLLEALYPEQV